MFQTIVKKNNCKFLCKVQPEFELSDTNFADENSCEPMRLTPLSKR